MVRVFLGGTCNDSTWRDELIEKLDSNRISYFNPVVKNWTENRAREEKRQRVICDYCLYTITPKFTGVYSVAEVIDDSNKRPGKTLFCLLTKDENKLYTKSELKSLKQVEKMVKKNGARVFHSLDEVARFLNKGKSLKCTTKLAYEIEKIAKSYDARRKKQYWQMLKKMYGDSDKAIFEISKRKDPNIYHGTTRSAVKKIMSGGLQTGRRNQFGNGAYFGPKEVAGVYSRAPLFGKQINAVRMKRPSELKGTKTLYPKGTKVLVTEPSKKKYLDEATKKYVKPNTNPKRMTDVERNIAYKGFDRYPGGVDKKMKPMFHIRGSVNNDVLTPTNLNNPVFSNKFQRAAAATTLVAGTIEAGMVANEVHKRVKKKRDGKNDSKRINKDS